jgi:chromosome segregation ATPase
MSDDPKDKDFAPINVEMEDRIPMASKRQANAKTTSTVTKSNNGFTSIVLVIAVIACASSAYLYTLNASNQNLLAENEVRLKSLENRLSATGEEMGNSTVALQVKVGELTARGEELWDQMDKLWASAWRRNQEEIKTLSVNFKNLQQDTFKLVKDLDAKVSDNKSTTASIQSRIDGVNTKVNSQANDLLSINVRQDQNQQTNNKHATTLREMAEKLILLEKRNTTLLQKIQQLESKLNEVANKSV